MDDFWIKCVAEKGMTGITKAELWVALIFIIFTREHTFLWTHLKDLNDDDFSVNIVVTDYTLKKASGTCWFAPIVKMKKSKNDPYVIFFCKDKKSNLTWCIILATLLTMSSCKMNTLYGFLFSSRGFLSLSFVQPVEFLIRSNWRRSKIPTVILLISCWHFRKILLNQKIYTWKQEWVLFNFLERRVSLMYDK